MITTNEARKADFFALAETLERLLGTRIGEAAPDDERLLLRHAPALQFSASDVDGLEDHQGHLALTTTFLGTTGPHGLLPDAMLEEPVLREGPPTELRAWGEVFHHRSIALFYRLMRRTRGPEMWFARAEALTRSAERGLAPGHLHAIAPLLATRRRGAQGLQRALGILLGLECSGEKARVVIEELAGARIEIIPTERTRLARQRHRLGQGTILGASTVDPSGEVHVLVEVGQCAPERWLEGGDLHRLTMATCRLFDASCTRFRITASLRGSTRFALGRGLRLGRAAALQTHEVPRVVRTSALT